MAHPARFLFIVFLFAVPAVAQDQLAQEAPAQDVPAQNLLAKQELPDKPSPQGNIVTRPFYDKRVRLLAEINAGAALWDDIATRMVINRGGFERDPFMRPFVHNSGTLAVETVGEVWVVAFLGDWMKHSSHPPSPQDLVAAAGPRYHGQALRRWQQLG
jgi:hypothetical protein